MKNVLQYEHKKLTPGEQQYIDDTVKHANKNNFTVHLIQKRSVTSGDGAKVNGFLSDDARMLAVATGKPKSKWFSTFLHESCHMDQSIEQAQVWKDLTIDGQDATDLVFMWLNHTVELNRRQLNKYTYRSAMVELDCERRSAKKIVKYGFDIDVKEYTQRANAYVYFYLVMRRTRKWYTIGKEPYNVKSVWSEMPDDFDNNYTRLPAKYAKLYERFCYGK